MLDLSAARPLPYPGYYVDVTDGSVWSVKRRGRPSKAHQEPAPKPIKINNHRGVQEVAIWHNNKTLRLDYERLLQSVGLTLAN